jgi:membrane-associated phospholipid phosphatase
MNLLDSSSPGFLNQLLQADYWLFSRINQQWTNPFFDLVFPFLRQSVIWTPLYLFLLVFAVINFGKRGWAWTGTLLMTGVISDLASSSVIRQLIFRLRPCQNPFIADHVNVLVNYCPPDSGFTSSIACNHFAAAMFIFKTLRPRSRWWGLVFLWAFTVSYAQVYVGLHYPVDVAGGAILGCLVGYAMGLFFGKQFGSFRSDLTVSHA